MAELRIELTLIASTPHPIYDLNTQNGFNGSTPNTLYYILQGLNI